jgi:hypothetical protein
MMGVCLPWVRLGWGVCVTMDDFLAKNNTFPEEIFLLV